MIGTRVTLSGSEKLSLIGTLSTMLSAGIPILETVDSLLEDTKGSTKKILEEIRADLTQGKPLNVSFLKFPYVFDQVTINVIKASEEAGTLETVLKDLKVQIQKDMEFIDKVKGALIYPLVILAVFIVVLLIILIVVIPKIAAVFSQLNVKLSLPTKILIYTSSFITQNVILSLIFLALFASGVYLLLRFKKQELVHLFYLFPPIANLVKEIDISRFSRNMHLLLSSGIIITTALSLASDVVIRRDIKKAISEGHEAILAGGKLSNAFRGRRLIFPSVVLKIIEAGERTGTLDQSMQEISEYMDYQVTTTLKTLTSLIEPLMLVVMGVLVGGMMMSIIGPIYSLIGQVGN